MDGLHVIIVLCRSPFLRSYFLVDEVILDLLQHCWNVLFSPGFEAGPFELIERRCNSAPVVVLLLQGLIVNVV